MTCKTLIAIFALICSTKAAKESITKATVLDYNYLTIIIAVEEKIIVAACTGCIITSQLILTSSECYINENSSWYAFMIGLSREEALVKIDKWRLHPHFIPEDTQHNTIAVAKTETDIDATRVVQFEFLAENIESADMECHLVGWNPDNLHLVGQNLLSMDISEVSASLTDVFKLSKSLLTPAQCNAQIQLSKRSIVMDDTLLCGKLSDQLENYTNYGIVGSPLLCKAAAVKSASHSFVGLKKKSVDLKLYIPETYMDVRKHEEYLNNIIKDFDIDPVIYFCEIQVCGKKYSTYGEYCIVGDRTGCIHLNREFHHYFPQSKATANWLFFSLLITTFLCVFLR